MPGEPGRGLGGEQAGPRSSDLPLDEILLMHLVFLEPRFTGRAEPQACLLAWLAATLASAFAQTTRYRLSSLLSCGDLRLSADEYALLLACPTNVEARRALGLDDEGRSPRAWAAAAACAHILRPLLERRAAWDAAGGGKAARKAGLALPLEKDWDQAVQDMKPVAETSPACSEALREVEMLRQQGLNLTDYDRTWRLACWMVHGPAVVLARFREEQELVHDPNPLPPREWLM
jgi:hypothetical protein